MLTWLAENLSTILVLAVLIGTVGLIVSHMVRSKKKGRSPCGCNCGGCDLCDICHRSKE